MLLSIRTSTLAIVSALFLLLLTMASGAAQGSSSGTSQVAITSDATTNYLAVQITTGDFVPLSYGFTDQLTTGNLTIAVTDTRGTAAGWGVNLSGSDFTGTAGSFAVTNLGLVPGTAAGVTGACSTITSAANQSKYALTAVSSTAARIWTANTSAGAGCFTLPVSAMLNVPGGTLVGTYASTITVSITAAP